MIKAPNKSPQKEICSYCLAAEPRWLYRVHGLKLCVGCLRSLYGVKTNGEPLLATSYLPYDQNRDPDAPATMAEQTLMDRYKSAICHVSS